MEKAQLVEKMRAQMLQDLNEYKESMPIAMTDQILSRLCETAFNAGYSKGMDTMFNILKDELLTEFA